MTILLNEDLLAVWFMDVSDRSNWLAGLSKHHRGTRLLWRMRYYEPGTPPDSPDKKNWYESIYAEPAGEVIQRVRTRLRVVSLFAKDRPYELIRGDRSLDEFVAEFRRAPFVHVYHGDDSAGEEHSAEGDPGVVHV
jgi:hypothetical protein